MRPPTLEPAPVEIAERSAPGSPAGPAEPGSAIRMPPGRRLPKLLQTAQFARSPLESSLAARRRFGDVWQTQLLTRDTAFVMTSHPDHVKSLMTAAPDDAPSLTGESPLRPILGPSSVLTLIGERHMRQRKLLLPPFHGDAVARYVEMIERVVQRELNDWGVGDTFPLAVRMQAVTLEVIMSGVFGIELGVARRSPEYRMRETIRRFLKATTTPLEPLAELQNFGHHEPRGIMKAVLAVVDRRLYAVIRARRASAPAERHDILSLLLQARDEQGRPLTDQELRDELMTLVLAGHETTANSLAWTFERLLRTPAAYARLRELVRDGNGDAYIEATIHEGMRVRPVIPAIGRLVKRPWQLGEYVVPADTAVAISIVALHHREDVYPDPYTFRPERFLGDKPGTYTWVPFGGGIRRCLGATLAMAEQRVVLRAIAARVDLEADDPAPEHPRQRNVTMIPHRGGRVTVRRKLAV
ncbi:MAG: cytochrome P450 [Actinomycetota bacterium]|nr:cytochrome P450 [Actinomycetota bacterium]